MRGYTNATQNSSPIHPIKPILLMTSGTITLRQRHGHPFSKTEK